MKLSKIQWVDIVAGKDWMSEKEAIAFAEKKFKTIYYTIGYIIKKTKNYVVVASSYTVEEDGELSYNDVSMIPKSVVRKIEQL